MDREQLKEVAPHYIAMVVLVFVVIEGLRLVVGGVGFWLELVLVTVVVFIYRPLVLRLGLAPSAWE